jgi:DivIVA domain-containing protein
VFALEVIGGIVVLLGLAFVLARNLPVLDDEAEDVADNGLPEGRLLRSDDIPRLRFRVGLRGYRMSDVDAALEAVRRSLAATEGAGEDTVDPADEAASSDATP